MLKMRYIDQWLSGLGLEHIIPKLTEHGITTPKKLAQLSLRDMYEIVGIEDPEDRKKLYYLIQRLNAIFKKEQDRAGADADAKDEEERTRPPSPKQPPPPEVPEETRSNVIVSPLRVRPTDSSIDRNLGSSLNSVSDDDDLKVLRKQRKHPAENSHSVIRSNHSDHSQEIPKSLDQPQQQEFVRRKSFEAQQDFDKHGNIRVPSPIVPKQDPRYIAPGPIRDDEVAVESSHTSGSGIAMSSFRPSAFGAGAEPHVGSVTAKVLARRQQRELEQQQAHLLGSNKTNATNISSKVNVPIQSRWSSELEPSFDGLKISTDTRDHAGLHEVAESPPPPAPPLSNSGSLDDRFSYEKSRSVNYNSDQISQRQHDDRYSYEKPRSTNSSTQQTSQRQQYLDGNDDFENRRRPVETVQQSLSNIGNDSIIDMAIRVVVRKRPISRSESGKGDKDVLDIDKAGHVYVHEPKTKVDLTKVIETHAFQFDDAFDADITNEQIYSRTVKALIAILFDFGKASCFAYGQTGSGKTFTMMGSNPSAPAAAKSNAGLYVLAARDIFQYLKYPQYKNLEVYVSCFEIYGGKLFDLLNDRAVVKCLEDAKQQVQLPGLTEHAVRNVDELLQMMGQAHSLRSVGSTGANLESSRSHQVLQIVLRKPEAPVPELGRFKRMGGVVSVKPPPPPQSGKLSFIDLAGSERGVDTTHNSKQTRMEGAEINTSLLALKEVIRSLERKHGHTPFRGSKLTQVLKDSFVGDKTRTCMIACVSPSHANCEHTLNTLRYADRVKEHQLSNGNGSEVTNEVNNEVSESSHNMDEYDLPASALLTKRPSTAQPSNSSGRSVSVGQSRPSTSVGVRSSMLPNRDSEYSRRDVQDERKNDYHPESLGHVAQISAPSRRQSESSNHALDSNRPLVRESKIPASPLSRLKNDSSSPPPASKNKAQVIQEAPPANPFARISSDIPPNMPAPVRMLGKISPERSKDIDQFDEIQERRRDSNQNQAKLLQKTVELLSAHKVAIAEMVEVMKDEMGLVQDMESSDDRDSEKYAEVLHNILSVKSESIRTLQKQLQHFQKFRQQERQSNL